MREFSRQSRERHLVSSSVSPWLVCNIKHDSILLSSLHVYMYLYAAVLFTKCSLHANKAIILQIENGTVNFPKLKLWAFSLLYEARTLHLNKNKNTLKLDSVRGILFLSTSVNFLFLYFLGVRVEGGERKKGEEGGRGIFSHLESTSYSSAPL